MGKIFVAPPQTLQLGIQTLKSPAPYCKLKKGKTTFRREHFHLMAKNMYSFVSGALSG